MELEINSDLYENFRDSNLYYVEETKLHINRILRYILRIIPSLTSLFINSFFHVYNLVEDSKIRFLCVGQNNWYLMREWSIRFEEMLSFVAEAVLVTGVPLIFAIQFYFTGRF